MNNLQYLAELSDEQLWAVAAQVSTWSQDIRLRALTDLGKRGKLSAQEQAEMEQLIDQVDQLALQRSQALLLLKQRGQDVETQLRLDFTQ